METILTLKQRNFLALNGVKKVNSATETEIYLTLENDSLSILGTGLHINKLDLTTTNIEITGQVNQIKYGKSSKESLLKKVFK